MLRWRSTQHRRAPRPTSRQSRPLLPQSSQPSRLTSPTCPSVPSVSQLLTAHVSCACLLLACPSSATGGTAHAAPRTDCRPAPSTSSSRTCQHRPPSCRTPPPHLPPPPLVSLRLLCALASPRCRRTSTAVWEWTAGATERAVEAGAATRACGRSGKGANGNTATSSACTSHSVQRRRVACESVAPRERWTERAVELLARKEAKLVELDLAAAKAEAARTPGVNWQLCTRRSCSRDTSDASGNGKRENATRTNQPMARCLLTPLHPRPLTLLRLHPRQQRPSRTKSRCCSLSRRPPYSSCPPRFTSIATACRCPTRQPSPTCSVACTTRLCRCTCRPRWPSTSDHSSNTARLT